MTDQGGPGELADEGKGETMTKKQDPGTVGAPPATQADLDQLVAVARHLPGHRVRELIGVAVQLAGVPDESREAELVLLTQSENGDGLGTWLGRLTREGRPIAPAAGLDLAELAGNAPSLLSRQGLALAEGWERAGRLHDVAEDAALAILGALEDFVNGRVTVPIDAETACGYSGTLGSDELLFSAVDMWSALNNAAEFGGRGADGELAQVYAVRLREEILSILANRGVIRGPCKDCGRPAWVPIFVPKNSKGGRRPLSDRLCPACEVTHVQRQETEKKRRYLSKREAGE